jgi:hypothetical protein
MLPLRPTSLRPGQEQRQIPIINNQPLIPSLRPIQPQQPQEQTREGAVAPLNLQYYSDNESDDNEFDQNTIQQQYALGISEDNQRDRILILRLLDGDILSRMEETRVKAILKRYGYYKDQREGGSIRKSKRRQSKQRKSQRKSKRRH